MNKKSTAEIVRMAKVVQGFAAAGDVKTVTAASRESNERAWQLGSCLVECLQHLLAGDTHAVVASDTGESTKKRQRADEAATACIKAARWEAIKFESKIEEFEKDDKAAAKLAAKTPAIKKVAKPAAKKLAVKKVAKPAAKTPALKKAAKPAAKKAAAKKS